MGRCMDRKTYEQNDKETIWQMGRLTNWQIGHTAQSKDCHSNRQVGWWTNRQMGKLKDTWKNMLGRHVDKQQTDRRHTDKRQIDSEQGKHMVYRQIDIFLFLFWSRFLLNNNNFFFSAPSGRENALLKLIEFGVWN